MGWVTQCSDLVTGWATEERYSIPGVGRGYFPRHCVQAASKIHPASIQRDRYLGSWYPEIKRRARDADHRHLLVPEAMKGWNYTFPRRLRLIVWCSVSPLTCCKAREPTTELYSNNSCRLKTCKPLSYTKSDLTAYNLIIFFFPR
jgi:hypothetical protein